MTRRQSHHAEWMELVEVSGPFLSLPVLERVFPQGLDAHEPDHAAKLRLAREEWAEEYGRSDPDPEILDAWIRFVLTETLDYSPEVLLEGGAVPAGLVAQVDEHHLTLRPDFVLYDPEGVPGTRRARLLVHAYPPDQDLDGQVEGSSWAASPATRMTYLCRDENVDVRLGLVTNGERWMLVDAPRGETAAYVSWYASLWSEEPLMLRAFRSLLGARRFFGVDDSETLEAMLAESASYQAEVTEQLGAQVRRAVEVLVQSLDRADADTGRQLLLDVSESDLYEAALTVMMRLVFLFFAEENDLLPLKEELYQQNYAASTLRGQLRDEADRVGLEVLERRQDAWSRLLASFRAIYGGVEHDMLHLPAYGGSLFDPDRFAFLEGRRVGTTWRTEEARPLPIDNRTVLHLLDALQVLQMRGRRGVEARKLSFRALDIEQIGHVYEMLLDHQVARADAPGLGLIGARGEEPEAGLDQLDEYRERGEDALLDFLEKETKKSRSSLAKSLAKEPDQSWLERLRLACGDDDDLLQRVLAYHDLIRADPWGEPVVIREGSVFVTAGTERRATGTYYTPRALTEEVVTYALEPLVYQGPAEGKPRDEWKLKGARELLDLKVCDPAMGSGAFLVQVIRWLSERLVEAWDEAEQESSSPITMNGEPAGDTTSELLVVPNDSEERLALARRLVVDRCIHGVDVNPLAVEMAKLSLWLVTLARGRPFSFLDHALKCGDSLLGVHDLEQIRHFHPDPERGKKLHATLFDPTRHVQRAIDEALELRRELESFTVRDIRDAEQKAELNRGAETALNRVRLLGDLMMGAAISSAGKGGEVLDSKLQALTDRLPAMLEAPGTEVDELLHADALLMLNEGKPPLTPDRRTFHWSVEFPEVFLRGRPGFDAVVGNPPFLGGGALGTALGVSYERFLKIGVPESKGSVDLAVYFHHRGVQVGNQLGTVALLGPSTLTTTANVRAGTKAIVERDRKIGWALSRRKWPGSSASIEVCAVCYVPGCWVLVPTLDGESVESITPALEGTVDVSSARRLPSWLEYSQGADLGGSAFVKSQSAWKQFLQREPQLQRFLRPYVNGEILCSSPTLRTDLLVADFGERSREVLSDVSRAVAELEVEVLKEGTRQGRQVHESRAWLFSDKRTKAFARARRLQRVIVCPTLSKHLPMALANPQWLFSKAIKFFVTDNAGILGLLQSTVFLIWAFFTSRMRGSSIAFSTRDSLDTFVPPSSMSQLEGIGEEYWEARLACLKRRGIGLTDLMNLFHEPEETSDDIRNLRELHEEIDRLVITAYGWTNLTPSYDFLAVKGATRYFFDSSAQQETLGCLLRLNHERYAAENQQLELGAK